MTPADFNPASATRCRFLLLLVALVLPAAALHAKRVAPPRVAPVEAKGLRFVVPNDDGRRAYVQAWDVLTGRMAWEVTVFRVAMDPGLEADVQHVFIERMFVEEGGKLILMAEDKRAFALDPKTRKVSHLATPPAPPKA